MNSYEALVVEIQNEARNFRDDNQKLKRNLENVIEENRRLRNEVHIEDPVTQFRSNYIEVADKIINTLRNQLVLCYKVYTSIIFIKIQKFPNHLTSHAYTHKYHNAISCQLL